LLQNCITFFCTNFCTKGWIKWLLILNGVLFAIPTLILPALTLPTNEAGTGLGNHPVESIPPLPVYAG
jgi:hypothetical protein